MVSGLVLLFVCPLPKAQTSITSERAAGVSNAGITLRRYLLTVEQAAKPEQ
jgi:hypothetical protein